MLKKKRNYFKNMLSVQAGSILSPLSKCQQRSNPIPLLLASTTSLPHSRSHSLLQFNLSSHTINTMLPLT